MSIILLGNTGAGKSTFIELQSNINISKISSDSHTKNINLYKFQNLNIIDTPGFNDSEEETQDIIDLICFSCSKYGLINLAIIFQKYTDRDDSNVQRTITDYIGLLNNKHENILICFTGFVTDIEKNELKQKYPIEIVFWNLNNYNIRTKQYEKIINRIFQKITTVQPMNSNDYKRIICQQHLINMLKRDQAQEDLTDEERIEIETKINLVKSQNRNRLISEWRCPGITLTNYRCGNSIYCHYYHNYRLNLAPKHHYVIDLNNATLETLIKYGCTNIKENETVFQINKIYKNFDSNIIYQSKHDKHTMESVD